MKPTRSIHVHSVYFWLRDDLTNEQKETFIQGLDSLKSIETVRQAYVGVPALTNRPVIDRSYSYALIVVFDDQEGHDLYQTHKVHDRFREECGALWTKVLIYDSVNQE